MLQSSPMTAPARTWAWFQTRVFGPILAPRSTSAVGWITLQYLDDPACRRAVAEGWLRRRLRSRPQRRLDDAFRVAAGEDVPAAPKRLRPLRFSPQRNTGHREEVSLALDAARVRGCAGNTTAASSRPKAWSSERSVSAASVFAARWTVAR